MDASVWAFQVLIITGLFSTARHRPLLLLTLLKVPSLLLDNSPHIWPPWQPFMDVRAICWFVWRRRAQRAATLPATNWGQARCRSCITAGNYFPPKTRTVVGNNSHQSAIFSAMKRHCCCQHCFLRERVTRHWEWNRAMSYKEDYKDKTTLTSLKFEDTSRETRRLSKSSCLLEGVAARCSVRPCDCDERDRKYRYWVFTSTQTPTLDRKELLKVAAIEMQRTKQSLSSQPKTISLNASPQINKLVQRRG